VSAASLRVLASVVFTLLVYALIGLNFATLPHFVRDRLHFGPIVAGTAISLQFLATFASRAAAGRFSDTAGPRRAVLAGWAMAALSGAALALPSPLAAHRWAALGVLGLSRLLLGVAESFVGTATITWAIARCGDGLITRIISWNGIMSYGGMALGAPLGVAIAARAGIPGLGAVTLATALGGFALAFARPAVMAARGPTLSLASVLRRVFPLGASLALASTGFGTIAAFVALYYAARGWHGAAFALAAFGACFAGLRTILDSVLERAGALRLAAVALTVEAAALAVLALAPTPLVATLAACVVGIGFSPIFPALGVMAVSRVPASSRGAALGVFNLFFDGALFAIGPAAGAVAAVHGYPGVFLAAGGTVAAAAVLVSVLAWRGRGT
jgi:MFS family permease